jgi:hypothetical protein
MSEIDPLMTPQATDPLMTPQAVEAYKHQVENLNFMKSRQWQITAYAIAILAWLFTDVHLNSLNIYQKHFLTLCIVIGCIVSCYFILKIQCEISQARIVINEVKFKYFQSDENTFGKLYKDTFCRGISYPIAFAILMIATSALVIFSLWP